MAGISLLSQAYAIHVLGSAHWQTMVFTVLTLSQMGNVLAVRSERQSLFRQGLLSNRWLLGAVVLTVALQMLAIYLPFFNRLLRRAPLSMPELTACLALSAAVFVIMEAEKWLARRGLAYR